MAKYIVKDTIEEFNTLNNRIQQAMIDNISGYQAERWCYPLISLDGTKYACIVDEIGIRNLVIQSILTDAEKISIIDIENTDEFWYNQTIKPF